MIKKKEPVLDEREMMEMYRIEHGGLWLMLALLCGAVVVQLFFGAGLVHLAGELVALFTTAMVLMIAYVRRGIWDVDARPSAGGNAAYSLSTGVGVAAVLLLLGKRAASAWLWGGACGALCFAGLTALMAYMQRRQRMQETELESELDNENEE